jgi:hypothetical protein
VQQTIEEMSKTFDHACSVLKISPSDPKAEQIARKIIELAQRGLRDSTPLAGTAMVELGSLD